MIKTQGTSAHFVYTYEDTFNGAQQRAAALQGTCEADLAKLEALFDATGGFDGGNTITVEVNSLTGLGENNGYKTGGATKIKVVPWSAVASAATADDGARLEFVAEMAEVLMALRNSRAGSTSWNPGGSNGEGLSQICAEELYPAAYYDSQLGHGPRRITQWLNDATRPDWVTRTEGTDKNFTSFGCAQLFIHFLRSQHRYDLGEIITKAGADLEATFVNLTGSGGGWNEFKALLDRFFPTGKTYSPPSCNPFPLYDDNRRSAAFSFTKKALRPPMVLPGGKVKVKPCFLEPEQEYAYDWIQLNLELRCTAQLRGFGNPVVTWLVDGVELPEAGGTVAVTGDVDVDRPDEPYQPSHTSETFDIRADAPKDVSTYLGHASAIALEPVDHPGHERLTIGVRVTEQYAPGVPAYTDYSWDVLDTRFVSYEPRFSDDREQCESRVRDFVRRHVRYRHINILLTLPDPPDEVISVAALVDAARAEVVELAAEEPELAREASFALRRQLRLSSEVAPEVMDDDPRGPSA